MADFTEADFTFMNQAIELARLGLGRTTPNPAVGAVVVRDGKIVGRGWHRKAGTPHAEVHALNDAGDAAKGATIYVTLEPCNHTGRTPPCTRAVLEAGISRVVIGTLDPNPSVAGGGMEFLSSQGLEVSEGCMRHECRLLIAPFAKHIKTGLPWVRMKVACSMDGRTATRTGHSQWITNSAARMRGHELRRISDAILVGSGTVRADNPGLTCRHESAREDGTDDPVRVVLDSTLSTDPASTVYNLDSPAMTLVVAAEGRAAADRIREFENTKARLLLLPPDDTGRIGLKDLLEELGKMGIQSVMVEGGATVHGAFLDAGLVDEAFFFYAPLIIGGSEARPAVSGKGTDLLDNALRLSSFSHEMLDDNWLVAGVCGRRLDELFE